MTNNNEYLREQGLDKLIIEKKSNISNRISAKYNDLIRIHKLILEMKPKDIKGDINGLSFKCDKRTVISGDVILMESTLLPNSFILVDGRTNNARFLKRMLLRNWKVNWDAEGDVTTFELDEEPLKYK